MPAICDVNVLLALATDRHSHHPSAKRWFAGLAAGEARVCRVAQLGLLRLLNHPKVMGAEALNVEAAWDAWALLRGDERVVYVGEEPEGLERAMMRFTQGGKIAPNVWTDAYLAAFAFAENCRLTTFDVAFQRFPGLQCELLR